MQKHKGGLGGGGVGAGVEGVFEVDTRAASACGDLRIVSSVEVVFLPIRPSMCHSDTTVMPLWTTTPCSCSCLCVSVYMCISVCVFGGGGGTTCLPKP